jgi:signal transduction histidine kinase
MLAHELRNPLAPIRNAAVLLTREIGADPKLGALTAMITRQSQHLTRLLDDLLDVSRIARGRIALQSEPVEIGEFIGPAIEGETRATAARARGSCAPGPVRE